jgi:nitroreductase
VVYYNKPLNKGVKMLTVYEAIKQRRSIRSFRRDPVPKKAIQQMLEAARIAPSGTNRQPWRFIVVTDEEERKQLSSMSYNQAFIEEAPVVFVCCVDLTAYSAGAYKVRLQEFIDYGIMDTLSGELSQKSYWDSKIEDSARQRLESFLTVAKANTFIAIEHMVLMATALDLGTCWVAALRDPAEVGRFFHLPPTMVVVTILPTGYPRVVPKPRPRLAMSEILLRPLAVPR